MELRKPSRKKKKKNSISQEMEIVEVSIIISIKVSIFRRLMKRSEKTNEFREFQELIVISKNSRKKNVTNNH